MLFNSLDFALFLPIVFAAYWLIPSRFLKTQNAFLLLASYIFYAWWDWRFLGLLVLSSVVDYFLGLATYKAKSLNTKKIFLWSSVAVNLGILGFFKYYNFFVQSFVDAFLFFGKSVDGSFIHIILPLGISFYTFQTLSYTIDIYRKKIEPTSDFVAFAAFVSFFPQLVAGPIERAQHLLPQFTKSRKFDSNEAIIGINQIVWGLFKKLVIADTCAQYVNDIFFYHQSYSSLTLILGAVYFSFQIYADFSGYSDIAIGTARLFGFQLKINFKYPYFAKNVAEFWRKWHISLSTWFRDYVYIPLGGSRVSSTLQVRNILIVFLVSGFWHGANWTFVLWGLINGILILPFAITETTPDTQPKPKPIVAYEIFQRVLTFAIITVGWIFFRSDSVAQALDYIAQISSLDLSIDRLLINRFAFEIVPLLLFFVSVEWYSRKKEFPLLGGKYNTLKVILTVLLIMLLGNFAEMQEFIYFQF